MDYCQRGDWRRSLRHTGRRLSKTSPRLKEQRLHMTMRRGMLLYEVTGGRHCKGILARGAVLRRDFITRSCGQQVCGARTDT